VERNHVLTATKHVLRNIFNLSKNVTKSNAQQLNEIYAGKSATVLIVGSGETADGSSYLSDKIFTKIRTDVYFSEALDVICDAHELPFRSQSIDVVWTQAVLEHVLKPNEVVSEIERVIKDGGHVYSEVPFLQAVHEGAFDYQRYTKLGHRYLFKHFELVSLGTKGGPLLSLYWAMKYFFRAIFGFRLIYIPLAVFSIAPFWLLSFFCKKNSSRFEDAANGTFFLGTKKPKQLTIELLTTLY
jgi:SAM-dependent methyltransferase